MSHRAVLATLIRITPFVWLNRVKAGKEESACKEEKGNLDQVHRSQQADLAYEAKHSILPVPCW